MQKYTAYIMAVVFTLSVLLARPGLAADAAAGTWQIDPVHSSIVWTIGLNGGLGVLYGRFDGFAGTIIADPAAPANSSVEVTVEAGSINTAVAARDEHLRNPDFFDAATFPSLSFKSTSVTPVAGEEGMFDIAGELTLHGVTQPQSVRAKFLGAGKDPKGVPVAGFTGSFSIKRSDFGMGYGAPNISDEVNIMLAFTCRQPQPTAVVQ